MFLNSPHFRNIIFNARVDKAPGITNRGRGGFALVFALAMLVLLMTIVLAYFSNAMLHRQISVASAANLKVQLITKTAADLILDDFQHEIEAGSQADANSSLTMRVRRPITVTASGVGVTHMLAPSMVPQRIGGGGVTNLVKVSRSGLPFFTSGSGYTTPANRTSDGLSRASAISTTTPSANGRYLTKERWLTPKLMSDSEANAFTVPDWIYLNRKGETPTDFSGSALATAANSNSTNTGFVIGRYAYAVYDVGGLLDINVIGNALPGTDNAIRGLAHQVSLASGIGGVNVPNFKNFVTWRSAVSSANANATSGGGGLFDPKRNFIDVPASEQAFVNRQDLLNYVAQSGSPIPSATLPFLTTFSRDLNAPSYEPNSARPKLPASPDPDLMNPALLSVRFGGNTTLHRPEGDIIVKSGSPVMPRRFPLSKLSLFEQASPDAAMMSYYFGLTKVDAQTWRYTATTSDGRIAKLSEVAALGREPNFFEILQAVLITGSLGKSASNTYTYDEARDSLQNLQALQIGANIIDQWDANDLPTCLQFPSGVPGAYLSVFGIENLPYLSQINLVGWRPTDNRDLFQVWGVFDVWNPHQNAKTAPSGIDGFRILPISGSSSSWVSYYMTWSTNQTLCNNFYSNSMAAGGSQFSPGVQSLVTLNSSRNFSFSSTTDYSEPTTLGGTPSASTDTPGLLLMECTPFVVSGIPSPAIPPQGGRTADLQKNINSLMDSVAPYTAVLPPPPAPGMSVNSMGQRVYPTGTTFTGSNASLTYPDPTYWRQEGAGNLTVYGNYGVKAHNCFRLLRRSATPYAFDLQFHQVSDNQWYTYQRFEGLFQQTDIASSPVNGLSIALGGEGATTADRSKFLQNTHHSAGGSLQNEFYIWRSRGASVGMIKADPRTSRFGLSGWNNGSSTPVTSGNDFMGLSVRDSTSPFTGLLYDRKWCVPNGGNSTGYSGGLVGGFELAAGLTKPPLFGLVSNNPDVVLNATNPTRYPDPDGVIRPGDGYFGALPTARGQFADRPILLNRPFRSVGELGYVFRDIPWKTLDFSTRRSGDLGLLDVFSISETDGNSPLTAGQINLNTRQTAALATALLSSSKQLAGVNASVPSSELSALQAQTLAQAIVTESTARPFLDRGDLVSRVLNSGSGTDPLAGDTSKVAREAAVRTLAEIGTTRTWNFLIDLVAQTGRFTAAAKTGSDFMVQSEERVWIHVAIDRMTGEVLELRKEVVNE
jgi:Tfp pilus assembly protein PilX